MLKHFSKRAGQKSNIDIRIGIFVFRHFIVFAFPIMGSIYATQVFYLYVGIIFVPILIWISSSRG
jgi:hypothetical protein